MTVHATSGSRRSGFSMLELLIAVTVLGILTLIAMPRIGRAAAFRDVAATKSEVSALLLRAKAVAMQRRRPVVFVVAVDRALATTTTPAGTTVFLGAAPYETERGVEVSPVGSLTVQANGLILSGTPYTIRLGKGGVVDSIRITGFGRVE